MPVGYNNENGFERENMDVNTRVRVSAIKRIEFFMQSQPLVQGNNKGSRRGVIKHTKEERSKIVQREFMNMLQYHMKTCMVQNKWEIVEGEPIYIAMCIAVCPKNNLSKADYARYIANDTELVTKSPAVQRYLKLIIDCCKELNIIQRDAQVVGALVTKRYAEPDLQGLDVLIGVPRTWGELQNDLRNN